MLQRICTRCDVSALPAAASPQDHLLHRVRSIRGKRIRAARRGLPAQAGEPREVGAVNREIRQKTPGDADADVDKVTKAMRSVCTRLLVRHADRIPQKTESFMALLLT
ncbi:MAG TPA: hypothetical protein VE398_22865 [Acidobacteriota bacterium]|nr:hypothetical protein [Acidobacteriota bacterium]